MSALATGGEVSVIDGYKIHKFVESGVLTFSAGGDVEILLVAGGGAGGGALDFSGANSNFGGGGAGGVLHVPSITTIVGDMNITVGLGGLTAPAGGGTVYSGEDSVVSGTVATQTAIGGGKGQGGTGSNGGSGGGNDGLGTSGQGNAAGGVGNSFTGSGGGGAGGAGGNSSSTAFVSGGGIGGAGVLNDITGTDAYYGAGGGGGAWQTSGGAGGAGGGGNGGETGVAGGNGTGYGCGGGGQGGTPGVTGGNGSSGVVIVRYPFNGYSAGRRVAQNEDLADMAASTVKGRITSTGIPQDLTVAELTTMLALHSAVTLDANADAVLSLTAQEIGLDTQAANKVFASPTTGAAAVPAFRALVAADIPALAYLADAGSDGFAYGRLNAAWAKVGGLALANVFTAAQKINVNSTTAFLVEQEGTRDDVFIIDTTNGRVGVGTASPQALVHFYGTAASQLILDRNSVAYMGRYEFRRQGVIKWLMGATGGTSTDQFALTNAGGATEVFTLLQSGFLGVGSITPLARLHVQDTTTTTNAVREVQRIETVVSTALTGGAAGFGVSHGLWAETSTDGTSKQQGRLWSKWVVPTNGSETSATGLDAYTNSTAQEFISGQGDAGGVKLSLYGGTRVARGAALTTQLTTITHTAAGTPDYALQDLIDSSAGAAFGFATKDEGNTLLAVVANLQTRVAELEARLGSATGINAFA